MKVTLLLLPKSNYIYTNSFCHSKVRYNFLKNNGLIKDALNVARFACCPDLMMRDLDDFFTIGSRDYNEAVKDSIEHLLSRVTKMNVYMYNCLRNVLTHLKKGPQFDEFMELVFRCLYNYKDESTDFTKLFASLVVSDISYEYYFEKFGQTKLIKICLTAIVAGICQIMHLRNFINYLTMLRVNFIQHQVVDR